MSRFLLRDMGDYSYLSCDYKNVTECNRNHFNYIGNIGVTDAKQLVANMTAECSDGCNFLFFFNTAEYLVVCSWDTRLARGLVSRYQLFLADFPGLVLME